MKTIVLFLENDSTFLEEDIVNMQLSDSLIYKKESSFVRKSFQ